MERYVIATTMPGFTLIEMLVTVSIMAILLGIGIPSYKSVMTSIRMSGEINAVVADMNFARSEAIKRGQNVFVCPSINQTTCSGALDWSQGWLVSFGTAYSATPTTGLLRISPGVSSGDTLTWQPAPAGSVTPTYQTMAISGYVSTPGMMVLHDLNNDASQRRCIQFLTGSWKTLSGGTLCP